MINCETYTVSYSPGLAEPNPVGTAYLVCNKGDPEWTKKKDMLFPFFYDWSKYNLGDPRISGPLDDTPFKRYEGREVLYFINTCANELWKWPYPKENFGKLEKMLKGLPIGIHTQIEVKKWILDNRLKFMSY